MQRSIFSLFIAFGLLATVQNDVWAECGGDCCASNCCEPQMVTKTVMVPTYETETRTVMCTEYQREERTRTYTVNKRVAVPEENVGPHDAAHALCREMVAHIGEAEPRWDTQGAAAGREQNRFWARTSRDHWPTSSKRESPQPRARSSRGRNECRPVRRSTERRRGYARRFRTRRRRGRNRTPRGDRRR